MVWSILFSLFLGCDILNVVKFKKLLLYMFLYIYYFFLLLLFGNCFCLCLGYLWVYYSLYLMFLIGLEKLNYRKYVMNL